MNDRKRAAARGITVGSLPRGPLNKISDVPGVLVGHTTVTDACHNTGVTVLLPCADNPFAGKLPCASFVWNGFGKTAGLIQIDELGTLETPIALTNTLNVGPVHDALVRYMVDRCRGEGIPLRSVNPVVCECNDASLNDICDPAVNASHVLQAIRTASADFEEGAVGAGRGMTCHGLKGGIGSASRRLRFGEEPFTLGVLVLTNHGRLRDLTVAGKNIGPELEKKLKEDLPDKGSCIVLLATDLPLSDRQLKRVIKRCSVGLARLGSYVGHGSGEVFIGFSTANRIPLSGPEILTQRVLHEDCMDLCFRAAAECTEEAVLNSLFMAETVTGPTGNCRYALSELLLGDF